jgi:O-antigen/teichoic acid export membrane protein
MLYNGLQLVRFALQLVLLPLLMGFLPDRLTGAVCAYLGAMLISFLACRWFVSRRIRTTIRLNMDLLRASVSYGLKAYGANLLHFLNTRLNVFMVAFFLGVTAVGQYAVDLVIVEALCLAAGSVGQILFPTVAAAGPGPYANQLTARVTRQVVFFMTLLCAGVALIAEPVIELTLGSLYLPSVQPLLLLLPGALALSIPKVLSQDLAGRGRPGFALIAAAVSLVIGLPLNLWLIPRWGISGAALSSTVAYTCTALVMLRAFSQCTGVFWRDTLFIRRSDLLSYGRFFKRVAPAEYQDEKLH